MKQALEIYLKQLHMTDDFRLQSSKKEKWGDYSCNIAFNLPGESIENAKAIVEKLTGCALIEKVWVAKPGFICIQCYKKYHYQIIQNILRDKENFYPHLLIEKKYDIPEVVKVYQRLNLVLKQLKCFREAVNNWDGLECSTEKELLTILEEFVFLKQANHLKKYLLVLSQKVNRYFDVITLLCENPSHRQVRLAFLEAIFWIFHNGLKLLQLNYLERFEW